MLNFKKILIFIAMAILLGCTKDDPIIENTPTPTPTSDIKDNEEVCWYLDEIDEENYYCGYADPFYKINDRAITNKQKLKNYDIDSLIEEFNIEQKDLIINRTACEVENEERPPYWYAGAWVRCDEFNNDFNTFNFDYGVSLLEDNMEFQVIMDNHITNIGIRYKDTKFKDFKELTKVIPDEVSLGSLLDDTYEEHTYSINTINQDDDEGRISISIYTSDDHTIASFSYMKISKDSPSYSSHSYYGAYRYK